MTKAPVLLLGDISSEVAGGLRRAGVVAVDTETGGLEWRTDRIGTCQLHSPEVGTFVVQTYPGSAPRLAELMGDRRVLKVFHHAPFDMRFIRADWGVLPQGVACTKIAARLLDPSAPAGAHSLAPTLQRHLGISLDKTQQVSDWLDPQLTPEQLAYAAADVVHLLPLLHKLTGDLDRAGLSAVYSACLQFLPTRIELEVRGVPDVFAHGNAPWSPPSVGIRPPRRLMDPTQAPGGPPRGAQGPPLGR